ncbi:MAG: DUF364 domain-containing protein [Deltaproteobacteria bacterium]|jgi:uncharacterized protein (DUF4213/DUF364 family)|nr:DUF364 domain-containing protein [Deltaproteobacteria bacterium]
MGFSSPQWRFYDHLIDSVPQAATIEAATFGLYWVAIKSSQGGTGLAYILPHQARTPLPAPESLIGLKLARLAERIKSWDLTETAMGLAAVTAAANSALLQGGLTAQSPEAGTAAFDFHLSRAKDKKVAVVGHFPHLENLRRVAKEFYILERDPQPGDLPDTAAEYLLPEMEMVFVTGSSLVNKTLPRLLELAAGAWVGLVGPSVPLLPSLFDFPLSSLSGSVFVDYPLIAKAIKEGQTSSLFRYGGFRVNLGPNFRKD